MGRSRAQVGPRPALPEEGVHNARRDIAGPDDLASFIDRIRRAERSAGEGPEVRHVALVPEERVLLARRVVAPPDDLTSVVDPIRPTFGATESAEIRWVTVLPQDGTRQPGSVVTVADHVVRLVDAEGEGFRASQAGENLECPIVPKEAPDHPDPAIGPDAIPGNVACIIDRRPPADDVPGRGTEVANRVGRRCFGGDRPKSGPAGLVGHHARADGLTMVIDAVGLAATAAEGAQIRHCPSVPEERISVAGANDLSRTVDAKGVAVRVTREGSQVGHRAVLPEERVVPDGGVAARPDDLAGIVDGASLASASRRKDPEVRHGPLVPEECMFVASPDDLSGVVDSKRDRVVRPAQASEDRHP